MCFGRGNGGLRREKEGGREIVGGYGAERAIPTSSREGVAVLSS